MIWSFFEFDDGLNSIRGLFQYEDAILPLFMDSHCKDKTVLWQFYHYNLDGLYSEMDPWFLWMEGMGCGVAVVGMSKMACHHFSCACLMTRNDTQWLCKCFLLMLDMDYWCLQTCQWISLWIKSISRVGYHFSHDRVTIVRSRDCIVNLWRH